GWSPGTKGKITGDVIYLKAQTVKELEAYKGRLKNAVVLLSPPRRVATLDQLGKAATPGARMGGGRRGGNFGRRNITEMMAFRTPRSATLQREGAPAISQDWGKRLGPLVTTGGGGGGDRSAGTERVPTLYVANNDYAALYRLATRPEPARTRIEIEVE